MSGRPDVAPRRPCGRMDARRAQRMIGVEGSTPRATNPFGSFALWILGLWPFCMLASIFAASSILLWVLTHELCA